ncbi:hypothetical protein [Streptomyces cinnamoneus]|nr:hypothetical protein [Streptomyces cinnamoneus]
MVSLVGVPATVGTVSTQAKNPPAARAFDPGAVGAHFFSEVEGEGT